jgi:hypothetical protein
VREFQAVLPQIFRGFTQPPPLHAKVGMDTYAAVVPRHMYETEHERNVERGTEHERNVERGTEHERNVEHGTERERNLGRRTEHVRNVERTEKNSVVRVNDLL